MGVIQNSRFRRNQFCQLTLAQFIRYLKSFYKVNLYINKALRLWVLIWSLLNFRTFGLNPYRFLWYYLYIKKGVTQKSWFKRNRFCRVTPAKFIRYLKSFYKANLDINKPLRLWVFMWTLLDFRTFGSALFLFYSLSNCM